MNLVKSGDIVSGLCLCVPYPPGPYPATGLVVGSVLEFIEGGIPIAANGDMVIFPCGTANIISMNTNWMIKGLNLSHTGDSVSGCASGTVVGTSQHLHI